jgi:hypothetical protein
VSCGCDLTCCAFRITGCDGPVTHLGFWWIRV